MRYYQANRARAIKIRSLYRRKARANPAYKAMERRCVARWKQKNPEKARSLNRKHRATRRARKRGAAIVEHIDRAVLFKRDGGICGICDLPVSEHERWHIDHIVPLSKGGEHSYRNVQVAHARCNEFKGDRLDPPPLPTGPSARSTRAGHTGAKTGQVDNAPSVNGLQVAACLG